jgi:hypothetical protein
VHLYISKQLQNPNPRKSKNPKSLTGMPGWKTEPNPHPLKDKPHGTR